MKPVGDEFARLRGDAVALVAHYDDAMVLEFGLIYVVSIKESSINGYVFGKGFVKKGGEVSVMDFDARYASHCRLHCLWGVGIGCLRTAYNVAYAEPIGCPDDGAEVTRVLYSVKAQDEFFG